MWKLLLILPLILIPFLGVSQSAEWMNSMRLNSLANEVAIRTGRTDMVGNNPIEPFQPIRDSILREMVRRDVRRKVADGQYIWPWHQYQTEGENGVPKLTRTWSYILKKHYNIRPSGLYAGCFLLEGMDVHDSFMRAAIEEKYGTDFFTRTGRAADSLDAAGIGLELPYIVHLDSTTAYLRCHFGYLDTVLFKGQEDISADGRFLIVRFARGKVESLVPVERHEYGNRRRGRWYRRRAKNFTSIARSLPWKGPRFAGKEITATIVYHLGSGEMWFERY